MNAAEPSDPSPEFDLDAVEPPIPLIPFRFMWNGRTFVMAHLQELDAWRVMEAAEGGDMRAMTGAFQLALGEEQWEAFRSTAFPQYKLRPLFDAYRAHCSSPTSLGT